MDEDRWEPSDGDLSEKARAQIHNQNDYEQTRQEREARRVATSPEEEDNAARP